MSNMGHCRFVNTVSDLRECFEKFNDVESQSEAKARLRLFNLCKEIINRYGDDAGEVPEYLEKEATMSDDDLYDLNG